MRSDTRAATTQLAGELTALHRRLELAEAAGDRAGAAALHARWLELERRRLALGREARPWHRTPAAVPVPAIDHALADDWLRGGTGSLAAGPGRGPA